MVVTLRSIRPRQLWAALLVLGAASAGLAPSADGDVWWHLAAGREMVARAGWLLSDPFSSGALGRPWVDVHWLFQLVAYAIHSQLGLAGLVAVKCLLVSGAALALFDALEQHRLAAWARPLFVTLLVAALVAARSLLLVRPVIVTLLCMALFFRELERLRSDPAPRRVVKLVLIQVVWANCQGLSAIGPAMVGAYAVASALHLGFGASRWWPFGSEVGATAAAPRPKLLWLALLGCGAGLLATPFGWHGLALSSALLRRLLPGQHNVYAHTVAENVPPFLLERWSGELWHLKWAFALLGLALLGSASRIRLSHALLLLGFGGLALLANRNVLLFYWVASPIAALHLAGAARRSTRWRVPCFGRGAVLRANALVLAGVLGVSGVALAREPSIFRPSPFRMPEQSAERLAALPGGGDVFAADHHGGYLIWRLYPRYRPYIDTRLVLRTAEEYAQYLRLADEPERFAAFQASHHFSYVVLPTAYPDRYLALIGQLYRSPDWKCIYTDGSEVLFARRDLVTRAWDLGDAATTERIMAELDSRYAERPELLLAAKLQLSTLQLVVGAGLQAERVLSGLHSREAEALRARSRVVSGDLQAARALAEVQLLRDRDDVQSLDLLAQIALAQGDSKRGLSFAERALRADPFDAEATAVLDRLKEARP